LYARACSRRRIERSDSAEGNENNMFAGLVNSYLNTIFQICAVAQPVCRLQSNGIDVKITTVVLVTMSPGRDVVGSM
jgi:hypothetical protein